ncbi:MAG TPA: DUF3106 domain-containing protein [Candidatus Limnocylindria bacterium]|nr:DUF3106 domain-containing protein [Candidatus Limnocylindria bacterium]
MKRAFQICVVSFALCGVSRAAEQTNIAIITPPLPLSPVQIFRTLLTTNAVGRAQWLALRSPAQRQYLDDKLKEYEALPAAEREDRLQTLQLRWYLPLLMKMDRTERTRQLAQIPQPDRALLEAKLETWDILPPALRSDILTNQMAISVFLPSAQSGNDNVLRALSPERREELQRQFEHLDNLPAERREQIFAHFKKFFELAPGEKNKALGKLAPTDREQMQRTLVTFGGLEKEQREQAMAGFKKFSELTLPERAAFLKTVERWQKMTEPERERWREIARRLQDARAKYPPPPMPSSAQRTPGTWLATTNF